MLTFVPPPSLTQIRLALSDLPDGFAGFALSIIEAPGVTADTLLTVADAADEASRERRRLFPGGDAESAAFTRMATVLRDAAPLFPHPPRLPLAQPQAAPEWRPSR